MCAYNSQTLETLVRLVGPKVGAKRRNSAHWAQTTRPTILAIFFAAEPANKHDPAGCGTYAMAAGVGPFALSVRFLVLLNWSVVRGS